MRFAWLDFLGSFAYHCRRVDHEDAGTMALVDVIPETPIYSVGFNAQSNSLVKVFSNNPEEIHSHDDDHGHARSIQPADHPATPLDLIQICEFLPYGPGYSGGVRVTSMQTQFTVEDENNFFFQLSRDDIMTTRATGSVEALARFTC